jgi:DNA-binding transcriptional MerR regulator
MTEMGPREFSDRTGLSPKALRLYEERGLLEPATVDPITGYRRFAVGQIVDARRIALLRRAGIGLAEIRRFLAAPTAEELASWARGIARESRIRADALGALATELGLASTNEESEPAMTIVIRAVRSERELLDAWSAVGGDRDDERRLADLRRALTEESDLLLGAYDDGSVIGAALGFLHGGDWATLRGFGLTDDVAARQELLAAFEAAAATRGAIGVALGGGDEDDVAFYVANGYRTQLLLQWVHDAAVFDAEVEQLLAGPLEGAEHSRSSFNGVPQLFVVLDEPNPTTRAVVTDLVEGAHVGYCMVRTLAATG